MTPVTADSAGHSRVGEAPGRAALTARGSAPGCGLVYSETSITHGGDRPVNQRRTHTIDPRAKRGKRCKTSVITAARLIEERRQREGRRLYPVMQDLTFADTRTWGPHVITEYVNRVRSWLARQGHDLECVWKLEAGTVNGRIHYHVLFWLPAGVWLPKADKRGWWKHGMTRTAKARNAVGYIAKYASKATDYEKLPDGARLFGLIGLDADQRRERMWWQAPRFARDALTVPGVQFPRLTRAPGGGWLCIETGEVARSRWRFAGTTLAAGVRLLLLVEAPNGSQA